MKMQRITCVFAVVSILSGAVYAQPPAGGPGRHRGEDETHRGREGGDRGETFMYAVVGNPKLAEELGLSDEQVQSLKEKMHAARIGMIDLRAELEKAGVEQARLLMESPVDEQAVMALVEKTGSIRTEMAKQRIKQLILLKNTLTPEQVDKAKELLRKRFEERGPDSLGMRGNPQDRQPEHRRSEGDASERRPRHE